jgi:hypothetical protein
MNPHNIDDDKGAASSPVEMYLAHESPVNGICVLTEQRCPPKKMSGHLH